MFVPQCSRFRRRLLLAGPAALAGAWFGCGPEPVADRRRQLLQSWTGDFLLARYTTFIEKIAELGTASTGLEGSPDGDDLSNAQVAWRNARRPWKETEVFKFGPVEDEPLRFGAKIDFWPVRPDAIEAVLESSEALDPDDLGAAAKGLPALEYLLFSESALSGFRETKRRYEYLRVLIDDLEVQARGLKEAWDRDGGNYQSVLVDAGRGSEMYDTLSMALSEVVNRMGFTIENIRADKLGAGIAADGTPQPDKLESQFSHRSIGDIRDNLRGIELLYFGDEAQRILALDDYLQHRGYQLGGRMKEELANSRRALGAINLPLSVAIVDEQKFVAEAIETLAGLQRLIQADVIGALSLSVRFNDNDGD